MSIQNELGEYLFLCEEMQKLQNFIVESPEPYCLTISPKKYMRPAGLGNKRFAFALMALTHGDETAGIGIVNALLRLALAGIVQIPFPIALILGNIEAAERGKRLWQSDLNRSFGLEAKDVATYEEKRARQLSGILKETLFFLDIHQTIEPSACPFFIFPYYKESYAFARAIGYRHHIVTHWGKPFSVSGKCTDQFVIDHGGVGISIELGQRGLHPEQIGDGLGLTLNSFGEISHFLNKGEHLSFSKNRVGETEEGKLFTFSQIEKFEADGKFSLRPGLTNFQPVREGDNLGTLDEKPLRANSDGFILFPKYTSPMPGKAGEAIRILKPISAVDLPKAD